jgi:hypothetical protein
MSELAKPLPARRPELLIRLLGEEGQYVVKEPRSDEFFQLGEAEHFLVTQLDGERTADELRAAALRIRDLPRDPHRESPNVPRVAAMRLWHGPPRSATLTR